MAARKTITHNPTIEEVDTIFSNVMTCEPALPPNEASRFADLVSDQEVVGRQWRLTAVLASKGGDFFRDVSEDANKAEALIPAIDLLMDFSKLLRGVADLADCAATRLAVAGCNHKDFQDWMKPTA